MKKIFPALLLATVLFACKKSTSTSDGSSATGPRYPVSFSIANFLVETQNMRVEADSSLTKMTDVYYFAYASDGALKSSIHQDTAQNKTNFGAIKDSLPVGTYTIVLYAATGPVAQNQGGNYISSGRLAAQELNASQYGSLPDIFFKKFQVTVNSNGSPATQDVTLNRITGMLKVELYDALPSSHPYGMVKVNMAPFYGDFSFDQERTMNGPKEHYGVRRDQTTFEEYCIGTPYSTYVHIIYIDKTTGVQKVKSWDNIVINANRKTIIKGYLYGAPDPSQGDYKVKANTSFTDSTVINF